MAKVRRIGDHGPKDQVSSGNSKHHRRHFGARYARLRISCRMALRWQPGRRWSGRLLKRRASSSHCFRRQARCFGCRRSHERPVFLGLSSRGRVSVNPPGTPSSGSTAGGGVHVVQRSSPQGKAEADGPGTPRAQGGHGQSGQSGRKAWARPVRGSSQRRPCAAVAVALWCIPPVCPTSVVAAESKPPRKGKRPSGCTTLERAALHARLPHRGNSLAVIHQRQRPPIAFCIAPSCFSHGRGGARCKERLGSRHHQSQSLSSCCCGPGTHS